MPNENQPTYPSASGPECVKTLITWSPWIIDVRWLSDRTVNAPSRFGRDLEHVTLFLQPWDGPKSAFFYSDSAFIKPLAPMIFMTRLKL
jgi:hypothetical protein